MAMYHIGDAETIRVWRKEANFDRACDEAFEIALMAFAADDCGRLNKVEGFDRTTDTLVLTFVSYVRKHHHHHYSFEATVERSE